MGHYASGLEDEPLVLTPVKPTVEEAAALLSQAIIDEMMQAAALLSIPRSAQPNLVSNSFDLYVQATSVVNEVVVLVDDARNKVNKFKEINKK